MYTMTFSCSYNKTCYMCISMYLHFAALFCKENQVAKVKHCKTYDSAKDASLQTGLDATKQKELSLLTFSHG